MRDPIHISDALMVLASFEWWRESGLSRLMFLQPTFGSLGKSLCIKGQNEKSFLPKIPTFLQWKLPEFGDIKKREFFRALHNSKPAD